MNELSYEQSLFNQQVNLRLGRLPAYTQFDGSELYCTFITSLCRTPAAYTFDRGYPPYLASSWAAVAQIRIAGPFYTNIGVYENEPVAATTNHGGFPGPDWGLNYADGATFPVQFGYRTTVQNDQYPRAFSVGGFYVTGPTPIPCSTPRPKPHPVRRGTQDGYGASEVYVQAQQMVYRPDASDRGLTVFGGANWTTSGQPNVERMVFAGAYYKGLFAQRPNDTLGRRGEPSRREPPHHGAHQHRSVPNHRRPGEPVGDLLPGELRRRHRTGHDAQAILRVHIPSRPGEPPAGRAATTRTRSIVGVLFEVDMAHLFGLPTLSR